MTRLSAAFAKPHPALVCFVTAGDGDTAAILDALVAGGGGRDRVGDAVHRSDGRWSGNPAGELALPRPGHDHRADLRSRRGLPPAPPRRSAGADGLCQPDDDPRPRMVRRRMRQGRSRRGDLRRHPARGGRRARPQLARARHLSDPPRYANQRCGTAADDPRWLLRVRLLRLGRRDHRAPAGSARLDRRSGGPAQGGDRPADRGRLRHPHPEQAAAIARVADGVVVGSAIVELVGEHGGEAPEMVREYVAGLAEAVHSARR